MTEHTSPEQRSTVARYKTGMNGRSLLSCLTLLIVVLMTGPVSVYAQGAGTEIEGKVLDEKTGQVVPGAIISLIETGKMTAAGEKGEYSFSEIQEGAYTLEVEHTGYLTARKKVRVGSGAVVAVNIQMISKPDEDADAVNFTNRLMKNQMTGFGDYSVEEASARFPGVQVNREGEINIRGVGFNSYYLTVDGQRMGTTGLGDRSYDLGSVSTDMVESIELIKVLTPDMAADGLAGVINLNTYQPLQEDREIAAGLSGGINPEYVTQAGPTGRAWFRYSEPVSEDMALSVNLSMQQDQRSYDLLNMGYLPVDFGSGNVDVLNSISPGFRTDERFRAGGSLQLDYTPNEDARLFLRGFVNTDSREITTHSNTWFADGDWDDANTTGSRADYFYDMNYEDIAITQFVFDAGGTHNLDNLILNYRAGWSLSSIERSRYEFPFESSGDAFTVDYSDPVRPEVSFVEEAPAAEDLRLQTMTYIIDNHFDNKITADLDAEIPFEFGSFKVGGSAMFTNKDANDRGAFSSYFYTYRGLLDLDGFDQNDYGSVDVFGSEYTIPWTIRTNEAVNFFQSSIPNMRLEEEEYYMATGIRNYYSAEQIYSGFGMTTLEFGDLELVAGARIEHTAADHDGRMVEFSRFGQFEEESDTTISASYTNIFPHAQLAYSPVDEASIHLAYSKTIARPDFNLLAPFNLATPEDTSLFMGNPELKPILSDNFDLFIDFEINETGLISLGGYYKMLSDFVMQTEETIQIREGEYSEFNDYFDEETTEIPATRTSYTNANEATVYGFEAALQQRLSFLPGALGNLGVYANYTWSDSEYESSRPETTAYPGQSTHAVNAAVDYTVEEFSVQVSYYRTSEALSMLAGRESIAPAAASGMAFMDRYEDGAQQLSANIQYIFNDRMMIYGNVYHLLMNDQIEYAYSRSSYPTSVYKRDGLEFNLGLRLTFK